MELVDEDGTHWRGWNSQGLPGLFETQASLGYPLSVFKKNVHSQSRRDTRERIGAQIKWYAWCYGVATIHRLVNIIGLFCKRALWKRIHSAKETYHFKEPTYRSAPISSAWMPWHNMTKATRGHTCIHARTHNLLISLISFISPPFFLCLLALPECKR